VREKERERERKRDIYNIYLIKSDPLPFFATFHPSTNCTKLRVPLGGSKTITCNSIFSRNAQVTLQKYITCILGLNLGEKEREKKKKETPPSKKTPQQTPKNLKKDQKPKQTKQSPKKNPQRNPKKSQEIQRNPKKSKETQKNPKKPKETQRNHLFLFVLFRFVFSFFSFLFSFSFFLFCFLYLFCLFLSRKFRYSNFLDEIATWNMWTTPNTPENNLAKVVKFYDFSLLFPSSLLYIFPLLNVSSFFSPFSLSPPPPVPPRYNTSTGLLRNLSVLNLFRPIIFISIIY
jgi:hypothetical protein